MIHRVKIEGLGLDRDSRCQHYHGPRDVVAMACDWCSSYFGCYQCHDQLREHHLQPISINRFPAVLCGHCRQGLTYQEYQSQACPYCQSAFNPNCSIHTHLYFQEASNDH